MIVPDQVEMETEIIHGVMTRQQTREAGQKEKSLNMMKGMNCDVSVEEVRDLQKDDESLASWWQKAEEPKDENNDGQGTSFVLKNGILYRKRQEEGRTVTQLVVPLKLRDKVLQLGHEGIMSGHQGIKRTYERVITNLFWPGVHGDVVRYCRSCDICQRTVPKGRVTKAPLGSMPLIETPFLRVAVDLVGPIAPVTDRGNRYVLTMIDYATRYPEAVALRNIDAVTVVEALVTMFTRVGIPGEILSDQRSQFMSSGLKEVSRLLSIDNNIDFVEVGNYPIPPDV